MLRVRKCRNVIEENFEKKFRDVGALVFLAIDRLLDQTRQMVAKLRLKPHWVESFELLPLGINKAIGLLDFHGMLLSLDVLRQNRAIRLS